MGGMSVLSKLMYNVNTIPAKSQQIKYNSSTNFEKRIKFEESLSQFQDPLCNYSDQDCGTDGVINTQIKVTE